MKLHLKRTKLSEETWYNKFIPNQLIPAIINRLNRYYNKRDYIKLNDYISQIFNVDIDCYDILKYALTHLHLNKESNNEYVMTINSLEEISGIKVLQLCSLINYGNLEVKGTAIINKVFNAVERELASIELSYYLVKGR